MKRHSIAIGGVEDHIHLLANLPPTIAVSDAIREIKAGASKWMNELPGTTSRFEWQKGYAAFSVSFSQIEFVELYLKGQVEHHRRKSFQEEYIEFLMRHKIEFEEAHLYRRRISWLIVVRAVLKRCHIVVAEVRHKSRAY